MKEQELLVAGLEETAIPQSRELIASGSMRKKSRDKMNEDEIVLAISEPSPFSRCDFHISSNE
jgi:hypothetical protein